MLALLLERPGNLISREEIRQRLWPEDTFVDFDHSLNNAVNRIREALGDSAATPRFIETVPRRGYRFIGELKGDVVSSESSESADKTPDLVLEPATLIDKIRRSYWLWLAVPAVVILLGLGLLLGFRSQVAKSNQPPLLTSLAVLPLENLTGDESREYLSDGLTDAIITQLAQVHGLRVISRTSTVHYKGTRKALREIARELHVDAIVEGTVTGSKDKMKVTVQLIYAPSDTHLWASSVTGSSSDALQLQSKVAEGITSEIQKRFTSDHRLSSPKVWTGSSEAYEHYLKGVYFYNRRNAGDIRTAIQHLKTAIIEDPGFSAAYSRLAYCYISLSSSGEIPLVEGQSAAKEAVERAMRLNDDLGEAHQVMAVLAWGEWDWARAEAEWKRAIELDPNSAVAHAGYSQLLLILGRPEESAAQSRDAKALDPISIDTLWVTVSNAYFRRQYDEGLVGVQAAIELYPRVPLLHVFLSDILAAKGQNNLAAREILVVEELSGATEERMTALRKAYAAAGLEGLRRSRIDLDRKSADGKSPNPNAYDIAVDYAAVGDKDQALAWLEKSIEAHDIRIPLIGVEPIFDSLRSEPRFGALLSEMGLG